MSEQSEVDDTPTLASGPTPDETVSPTAVRGGEAMPEVPGYQMLGLLGQGGMGAVWRARDINVNRVVALKVMRDAGHAEAVARFRLEAEAASRLDHQAIVPVYEVGLAATKPYFTMKLVDGSSLSALVPAMVEKPVEAARVMAAVARAIHHAHQRGVLHRDLKPANILVDPHGQPHVTDFGLARNLGDDSGLTRSGVVMGTPSYMAPEQAAGERHKQTVAVDVYGLGAVLYETLTGRPPFRGESPLDTLVLVRDAAPEPPMRLNPRVDRALESVCLRCLEKRPEERYASAAALADDLEAWGRGESVSADSDTASILMRMLLRETRHTEVMQRWGRVWIAHAAQVFVLFTLTNVLMWAGVRAATPYLVLWIPGMAAMLAVVWHYRFRSGVALTPIEWQLAQLWTMFGIAFLITGVINHLMGLEVMRLLPLVVLQCGVAFGCMASILGGSFYVLAGLLMALSLVLAVLPGVTPALFGLVLGVGLAIPGFHHARASSS